MDVNNVIIVINTIQNNNPLFDWFLSIIENSVISIIGGLFAAIISVYITIEYTVIKGDAIKFNKIMIKVIFEIKEIKRKMGKQFFEDQIEQIKLKAEKRKKGIYVWVGFNKEDYNESFIVRYQFLPFFWLMVFFSQAIEVYNHNDRKLSEKISLLRHLLHSIIKYNNDLQIIENHFNEKIDFVLSKSQGDRKKPIDFINISPQIDSIVDEYIDSLKSFYEENTSSIEEYIYLINPEYDENLLIKVKFWSTIFRSFIRN